jgi:hypothetical protein
MPGYAWPTSPRAAATTLSPLQRGRPPEEPPTRLPVPALASRSSGCVWLGFSALRGLTKRQLGRRWYTIVMKLSMKLDHGYHEKPLCLLDL